MRRKMRVTGIRVILALAILSSLPLLLGGVAVADVRGPEVPHLKVSAKPGVVPHWK